MSRSRRLEFPIGSPLYHAALNDPASPPATYWHATGGPVPVAVDPLRREVTAEVAVIGGGYTGLVAALRLAREFDVAVRVLEAGPIGWGASGRNGGFCTLGGTARDWAEIARRFGVAEARAVFRAQRRSVELVRELAAAHRIDLRATGEGEYVVAHKPSRVDGLAREAAFVAELVGERFELLTPDELRARGIALAEAYGALHIPHAFGLHPLRYLRGLCRAAVEHGARVHERTPVVRWDYGGGWHHLATPGGAVRARRVLVATNGWTPEGLRPELAGRVLPVLSSILVTRPLTPGEREAQGWVQPALVADTRELLFYIRLLEDGRILFGARGGTRGDETAFARRMAWLEARFRERFPALAHVRAEFGWWGLVAFARDRLPHLVRLESPPASLVALAYHGSGIAMATLLGWHAAAAILGHEDEPPLPACFRRPLRRFPLPALRLHYLRAAMALAAARDAWW